MKIKKDKIIIAVFIIAFIYSVSLFKNILIKSIVTAGATQVTGADVKIKDLSFDILDSSIHINGFQMYNPVGFPKEILIDIPKIQVEYDLSALLKKQLHLPWVEIDLKEIAVIKNRQGRLNVNSLKFAQKKEEPQAPAKQETQKTIPMHIDLLKLNIGRVIHKDFSVGEKPSVEVYNINIKKTYKNITGVTQLVTLVLAESFKLTTIKGAEVYGVATLVGVAALPVGVASVLISRDSAKADFDTNYGQAFRVSLEAMDDLGDIIKAAEQAGYIKGQIHGIEVVIKISKNTERKINIAVSARKYMLPKPNIAEGVLYEISQKLK